MNETSGLRVSVDVGCYQHSVAVGLSDGTLLDEFDLSHEPAGFDLFFERIDRLRARITWTPTELPTELNDFSRPLPGVVPHALKSIGQARF